MTQEQLENDAIARRKKVFDNILAEIDCFGLQSDYTVINDLSYEFANFRIVAGKFFFDFRIDLVEDDLIIPSYTHKRIFDISEVGHYDLSMANIDELLFAIQSYKDIYKPNLI